jgi:group I intron endonuclease
MKDRLKEYLETQKNQQVLGLMGVYSITNKWTAAKYIGSTSRSFKQRFEEHQKALSEGTHSNPKLQNSYNYNPASFIFEIIEAFVPGTADTDFVIGREQHYVDTLKPEFNVVKDCDYRKPYTPQKEVIKWILTDPQGVVYEVAELEPFCAKYKEENEGETLNARYLSDLARGKRPQYKGWDCRLANEAEAEAVPTEDEIIND